ncbi:MAG: 3-deoxy-8-phosphooctulonate synthase [Verrucomicrobia bacterium]|nr:3-deoxy-8-phosphooctulonate synthase [Verrucomicrobiota bacterium]
MNSFFIKDFDIEIGLSKPLVLIAGPCVIEGEEETLLAAEALALIAERHHIPFIFKSSYDKANRASLSSFRGPGLVEGLRILSKVRQEMNVPIYTDVHSPEEAARAGEVCDAIQMPAFLCRQTDLAVAAAKTGRPVFIKKGQFMAPWDMGTIVEKVRDSGNDQIALIERGFSFGYNNLVTDFRSIPIMQDFGVPVVFDGTHSVQLPGGLGKSSGGQRQFIPHLTKAAVAAGANALFLESHPHPQTAKSDGPNMLDYAALDHLLGEVKAIFAALYPNIHQPCLGALTS